MTQGVQDLIKAIDSGDSQTIDAAFQAEMANRISTRLEDLRVSVAQGMFATEQAAEETAEEEVSEEAEEIEEEVEQIDEAGTITGKIVKGVARVGNELKDAGKGTAELGGQAVGTVAKTAGAIAALPGATKAAYQQGKANTYNSVAS